MKYSTSTLILYLIKEASEKYGAKFSVLLWYLPSIGLMEWIESGMNIKLGLQI